MKAYGWMLVQWRDEKGEQDSTWFGSLGMAEFLFLMLCKRGHLLDKI